jgi:hypothetical protein
VDIILLEGDGTRPTADPRIQFQATMTRSVRTLVSVIGALSIASGAYLAFSGSDLSEYFSGIFLGITLLGSTFFYKEEPKP